MSTVTLHAPEETPERPIHGALEWLFLSATRLQNAGTTVTAPGDFDAELHIETTTIMFADVVESVRLIERDELANVTRIRALLRQLAEEVVPRHGGTVLERRGDGLLLKFSGANRAAACALDFHSRAADANRTCLPANRIELRVGIHSAEMIADDGAIYGQGINVAARITSIAGPGETVASASARDGLVAGVDASVEDLGDCYLKHVTGSVHVFRLSAANRDPVRSDAPLESVEPALPRIAILPMRAVRGEASGTAITELLGESLVHALANSDRCTVTSWLSSRVFSGRPEGAEEIGRALGAQWLLTGSLFQDGEKIVVAAVLNHAKSESVDTVLRVTGTVADLLTAESMLIGELAQGIVQKLLEAEAKRVAKHSLPTLQSHSLLTGAIGLMHRSRRDSFSKSREALDYLLDRHPRMHAVRPWLAQWFVLRNTRGYSDDPKDDAKRAIEQTRRALDALPTDALSLAMQGFVTFHIVKDIGHADELIDQALAANPNEVFANIFASATKAALGDYESGWLFANRALAASPFDPLRNYIRSIAASSAVLAKRYEACFELSMKSVQENASHPAAWRTLVMSAVITGRMDVARNSASRLLQLQPELTVERYRAASHLPDHQLEILASALSAGGVPLR